jgi:hypothetical protein
LFNIFFWYSNVALPKLYLPCDHNAWHLLVQIFFDLHLKLFEFLPNIYGVVFLHYLEIASCIFFQTLPKETTFTRRIFFPACQYKCSSANSYGVFLSIESL